MYIIIRGLANDRDPKPIAWVRLLELLRNRDQMMTVNEVQLEAKGRKDVRAALRYFHDLGEVRRLTTQKISPPIAALVTRIPMCNFLDR